MSDHQRLDYELNPHGDKPRTLKGTHGTDISSSRLGDLDRSAIRFVLDSTGPVSGVDVGCGLGFPSIAMALTGADMTLVDVADLSQRFSDLSMLLPSERITFLQKDIRLLSQRDFPTLLNFLYSQRTIHYLPYVEALQFLRTMYSCLVPGGRVFISASGMKTELSVGYEGAALPVTDRFFKLTPDMAKKHEIHEPICMYYPEEFETLLHEAGFTTVELITSGKFGNVKGIFSKP